MELKLYNCKSDVRGGEVEIDKLWKSYKKTGSSECKDELIKRYSELVKIISGRLYNFYGGNVEYDDLVGFGAFGLIDAIDKFDLDRGLKFETYAQIRIRGAIIDNLRKLDWIPRRVRKKSKDIENATRELENEFGRSATVEEIAGKLEISLEEINNLLSETAASNVASLEETLQNKGELNLENDEIETPEMTYENKELKNIIAQTIESLNNNEKLVISLYYYDELTYKEIGKVLDLSESRISQIHSKAIISMKSKLSKQGIDKY